MHARAPCQLPEGRCERSGARAAPTAGSVDAVVLPAQAHCPPGPVGECTGAVDAAWSFSRGQLPSHPAPAASQAHVVVLGKRAAQRTPGAHPVVALTPFQALEHAPEHAYVLNRLRCVHAAGQPAPTGPFQARHWTTEWSVDLRELLRSHARAEAMLRLPDWPLEPAALLVEYLREGSPQHRPPARALARLAMRQVQAARSATPQQTAAVWAAVWATASTGPAAAVRWLSVTPESRARFDRVVGALLHYMPEQARARDSEREAGRRARSLRQRLQRQTLRRASAAPVTGLGAQAFQEHDAAAVACIRSPRASG